MKKKKDQSSHDGEERQNFLILSYSDFCSFFFFQLSMEEGGNVIFSLCKATKGLHPPRGGGVSLNSTRAEYRYWIPPALQRL